MVTIHDLNFLTHPERTRAEIRRDYPALARAHAQRADRISCRRAFTAGEVERRLGVPADRIAICPPGAPDWTPRAAAPADGYVLFFGTLEPRKNVGGLLDAYEQRAGHRPAGRTERHRIGTTVPELILAGRATPDAAALARADRAARRCTGCVRHLGYVDPDDRRALYEGARLLVQPSFEEGFGMPVLEAMTLGVPVVAANRGALPEVLGDAGPARRSRGAGRHRRRDRATCSTTTAYAAACARARRRARARVPLGRRPRARVYETYQQAIDPAAGPANPPSMRIGIDARELCGQRDRRRPLPGRPAARMGWPPTGRAPHEFVLYAPEPIALSLDARRFPTRMVAGRRGTWWEQVQLPRAVADDHLDVWFAPAYTAPLRLTMPDRRRHPRPVVRRAPGVVSLRERASGAVADAASRPRARGRDHDFGVLEARADRSPRRRRRQDPRHSAGRSMHGGSRPDAERARRAIARSRCARGVLFVGFDLQPAARPRPDSRVRAVARAHPERLARHRRRQPELSARGSAADDSRRGARRTGPLASLRDRRSNCRRSTRGARAFAFLSEYEGLGLTPLEALAAGVPPVLLDTRGRARELRRRRALRRGSAT